jgi:DNA-binding phage protein
MPTSAKSKTLPLDTHQILAAALAKSKMTKAEFARNAGIGSSDLRRYMRPDGSSMSTATLSRVLEANGLRPLVTFQPVR